MSQRSDRDYVDAAGGRPADGVEIDTSARFQNDSFAVLLCSLGHGEGIHVVKQDDVSASFDSLLDLSKCLTLHLDPDHMPRRVSHACHGFANRAGSSYVVVLDHHGVEEAEAVVLASSAPDCIFLERPQPRNRFACVSDARFKSGEFLHELVSESGDTTQVHQVVQGCPLSREEPGDDRTPGQHDVSFLNWLPVFTVHFRMAGIGIFRLWLQEIRGDAVAAQNAIGLALDFPFHNGVRVEAGGRQVTGAEIFFEGSPGLLDPTFWGWVFPAVHSGMISTPLRAASSSIKSA